MLTNLMVVNVLQYLCVLHHHAVHLKLTQYCVKYIATKLEERYKFVTDLHPSHFHTRKGRKKAQRDALPRSVRPKRLPRSPAFDQLTEENEGLALGGGHGVQQREMCERAYGRKG